MSGLLWEFCPDCRRDVGLGHVCLGSQEPPRPPFRYPPLGQRDLNRAQQAINKMMMGELDRMFMVPPIVMQKLIGQIAPPPRLLDKLRELPPVAITQEQAAAVEYIEPAEPSACEPHPCSWTV